MEARNDANDDQEHKLDMPPENLLLLSIISALVYASLALLIFHYFHETGLVAAFDHGYHLGKQLLVGVAAGGAAAAMVAFLMNRSPVSDVLDDFYIVRILKNTKLTKFDCIQLSLFAGSGEELLFRGAIQPLLGIWITSVIFVGLHGYFKFRKSGHYVFGLMMFGLSVGLGYVYEYAGLVAAMSMHAVYDMIMLMIVVSEAE